MEWLEEWQLFDGPSTFDKKFLFVWLCQLWLEFLKAWDHELF